MTNLSGTNLNNGAAVGPQGEGRDSPSTFPKYPDYKESGADWCGVVPAEWQVLKLKRVARLQSGEFITSEAIEEEAQYPVYGGNGLRGYTTAHTHEGEYALVGRQGALCGNINYACGKFWASEHAVVVYPERGAVTRWLGELLRSMNLGQYSVSAAQPGLSVERIADLFIPVPSPIEQTQIARFLDHETARIDALIEEQQRLIELLKEKRQAVISHAVTKGLDPTVPMKDSGVEWLGEVPAHWVLKRIKHVTLSFDQGWSPQCENQPVEDDMQPGVLKTGCVNGGIFRSDENKRLPDDLELVSSLTVHAGDLLVSRANTRELVGSAAVPTVSYPNLMISDKIFRVRVMKKEANSRFLAFYLGSPFARREIELSATGASSSMLNISQSAIADMLFPCPPVLDQERIVRHIVEETYRLLALAEQALRLKELLQERRSALISAAVTGKIDVRGWQPPVSTQAPKFEVAEAV